MEIDYRIIGTRIREIRRSRSMTQADLAEKSGVEPSNISHIERAATKLSLPTLIRIANALGCTLDELVYSNLERNAHVSSRIIDDILSDCTDEEIAAIAEMIKTTKRILRSHH